jgi:hypothetical protein
MAFMHPAITNLVKTIALGLLLIGSIPVALAQVGSDVQQDPRREWFELAKGRNEFEISDPALLPTRLTVAVEQSGCAYKDEINSLPARFIRIKSYRLAVVFCRSGIVGSYRAYDMTDLRRPRQMEFPTPSYPNGFHTTSEPGMITWKTDTQVFEAVKESDMGCTGRARHTYRLGDGDKGASFVITRVDIKKDECKESEWTTIWETPTWSELYR